MLKNIQPNFINSTITLSYFKGDKFTLPKHYLYLIAIDLIQFDYTKQDETEFI